MKLSTKPIQSPGRTDKYPPTPLLMRTLRLQGGSRRATPRSRRTFSLLRRRASNYEGTTTQEPSSPKVTCIGQVRVKKKKPSSSSSSTAATTTTTSRRKFSVFCRCFPGNPPGKSKSSSHGTVWRRFMTAIHDPLNKHAEEEEKDDDGDDEDDRVKERVAALVPGGNDELRAREAKDEDTEGGKGEERAAAEPPKNALLLMRCRSAPLRDSSPMSRLWESPVVNSRGEQGMPNGKEEVTDGGEVGKEDDEASAPPPPPPPSPPQPVPAADLGRASTDGAVSGGQRRRDGESEWAREGISGIGEGGESSPVLTRCKSEPRPPIAAGIFPEAYFWKRRVGFS